MEKEGDIQKQLTAIVEQARGRYRTVGDTVTSALREAILSSTLLPGEHLRQDELARLLDVSRMPVRSALLQLDAEGLVEFHPHRGAVVAELDPSKVREIYKIRAHLEGLAIKQAIENMTPERLQELEKLASRLDALEEGDQFLRTRVEFYDVLYDKARNPLLVDLIQRLRGDVGRYWLRLRVAQGDQADSHRQLLRLVGKRDVAGAQAFLQNHLERVRERLAQLIEDQRSH